MAPSQTCEIRLTVRTGKKPKSLVFATAHAPEIDELVRARMSEQQRRPTSRWEQKAWVGVARAVRKQLEVVHAVVVIVGRQVDQCVEALWKSGLYWRLDTFRASPFQRCRVRSQRGV
jgi:hypothetical protein